MAVRYVRLALRYAMNIDNTIAIAVRPAGASAFTTYKASLTGVVNKNLMVQESTTSHLWAFDESLTVNTIVRITYPWADTYTLKWNGTRFYDSSSGLYYTPIDAPAAPASTLSLTTAPWGLDVTTPAPTVTVYSDVAMTTSLGTYQLSANGKVNEGRTSQSSPTVHLWSYNSAFPGRAVIFTFPDYETLSFTYSAGTFTQVGHQAPQVIDPGPTADIFSSWAYLREDNVGVVCIRRSNPWASAAWKATMALDNVYTDYSLYSRTFGGLGTLSSDGMSLTILIPNPPQRVLLSVSNLIKEYTFYDGESKYPEALVFKSSVVMETPTGETATTPAFLYFFGVGGTVHPRPFYKGRIVHAGEVVALCEGLPFASVRNSNTSKRWGFEGVIFSRVYWIKPFNLPPGEPVGFWCDFGHGQQWWPMTISSGAARFTQTSDPAYNVRPGHIFSLAGRKFA